MSLREEWQKAKAAAEADYRKEVARLMRRYGPEFNWPGFPSFSKGLGPALDAWEKERDETKKEKLEVKIRKIVKEYRKRMEKHGIYEEMEKVMDIVEDKVLKGRV